MTKQNLRASAPISVSIPELGPLAELPGTWVGKGFNLIALPVIENGLVGDPPFRVQLNTTHESLTFTEIGAPIPNRGSIEDDIEFLGLHYLQHVNDASTYEALHHEVGMWLHVPDRRLGPRLVRQSSIPHGTALIATGEASVFDGGPHIRPESSTPTGADVNADYLLPYSEVLLPPGVPAGALANPNLVLTEAILGQEIVSTVELKVDNSNEFNVGNLNISFLGRNAAVTALSATFWIETVQQRDGRRFMQLQYTQTVVLNFLGIDWPHISVATLVKQ